MFLVEIDTNCVFPDEHCANPRYCWPRLHMGNLNYCALSTGLMRTLHVYQQLLRARLPGLC